MNPESPLRAGYSADVRMHLYVGGRVLAIAQLGPDFLILREPVDHPPAEAEIALSIAGRIQRWPVRPPEGIAASRCKTSIGDGGPDDESTGG